MRRVVECENVSRLCASLPDCMCLAIEATCCHSSHLEPPCCCRQACEQDSRRRLINHPEMPIRPEPKDDARPDASKIKTCSLLGPMASQKSGLRRNH